MNDQKIIYIPIGEDCYSTIFLQNKKMRLFATIFDWIQLPSSSILKLFENNFEDYCQNVTFHCKSNKKFRHTDIEIYDTKYDVLLPHAVDNMNESLCKYQKDIIRRIQRLEDYLKKKTPICFIFKPLKYKTDMNIHLKYNKNLKFGKKEFISIYPKLVNILINRYNYKKELIKYEIIN